MKLEDNLKSSALPLTLILLGILFIILGLVISKDDLTKGKGLELLHNQESASSSQTVEGGKISLNKASLPALISLPGVGEVTGRKIIQARPFASISELLEKKIVKKNVYEKIKDLISVL